MKIEAVDFFYLSMPVVTDAGDGSQDALVVRVAAGGLVGWGECEASPLTSIAAYVCPMSHGACKPVRDVVLGRTIDSPADIAALAATVELECMDLLQAAHTFSGIEMALWDLLGKKRGEPVWKLLGYAQGLSEAALCLAALRRHAAGDAGRLPQRARKGLSRRQMRLGTVRARLGRDRPRSSRGGARRHRRGQHAAHRRRPDLAHRCRSGRRAHPGSRAVRRRLAGGAVPRRRLRGLWRARRRAAARSASPAAKPRTMSTWRAS